MKESRFIAQNKEKWHESEKLLNDSVKDPEKLSDLFTQVVDDLSFSRTYYRHRSVRVYLNQLAREYFSIIYSHRKDNKNRFKYFWLDELPQLVIHSKRQLLVSLAVFLLAVAIGVFSSANDPKFASSILGPDYVAMTKANIKKGDPMAVYKGGKEADMFLGITFNNLKVAFITYVFGIFMAIGTIAILIGNGVMVGCFQYFFVEHGLLRESALTIWLHGTLEISCIIIAGGAGLTLGSGLLFPGTYSRFQSFQISALRSLKLMLGIAPIIVLAAIIESFMTRYTETPDMIRLALILLSAFFIIGYFIVYPWYKSKQGFLFPLVPARLEADTAEAPTVNRIVNNAGILQDAFVFYKKFFNRFIAIALLTSLAMAGAIFWLQAEHPRYVPGFAAAMGALFSAMKMPEPVFILINTLGCAIIVYRVITLLTRSVDNDNGKSFSILSFLQVTLVMALLFGMLYVLEAWGAVLLILSFMIFFLVAFAQHDDRSNIFDAGVWVTRFLSAGFGQTLGLQMVLVLMVYSFMMISSAPLLYVGFKYIQWNFAESDAWIKSVIDFILLFVRILIFNLILPLITLSAGLLYYTLQEIHGAHQLKKSIAEVGAKISKTGKR